MRELTLPVERLAAELGKVRVLMQLDAARLQQLFVALERGAEKEAQKQRDALVRQGLRVGQALTRLEGRVTSHVDGLVEVARKREQMALQIMVGLGTFTLLVGMLMTLYAGRVLRPLSEVTRRATAVAAGDLSAQDPMLLMMRLENCRRHLKVWSERLLKLARSFWQQNAWLQSERWQHM